MFTSQLQILINFIDFSIFHKTYVIRIEIPEEYGGSGSTFFSSIIAIEEFAKVLCFFFVFKNV